MFTLIHGNRQEVLAQHLAARLAADPLPIFEREVVVVQSGGMARWLQMYLAEALGVAAQLRFTFPAGYLWRLFGAVLPDVPRETPFARDILGWQLLRLLADVPATDAFAPVRHYLAEGDVAKRHALAERLADCFDRYLAYRPDWVGLWLAGHQRGLGEQEAWQACLWQRIGVEAGTLPAAHPAELFFQALARDPGKTAQLPKRITVFGSGAMPPPYLQVFKQLGQFLDVHFYLVNPCAGYWGDLVTQRTKARAALDNPALEALLETGHPLLGSLGQVTRATFDLLAGEQEEELFVAPAATHVLATLQQDLLDMRTRGHDERVVLNAADDSVQIHICHGATRELEVLHDRLLALFAADPTLRPSDVLVLTPDIIGMAPLIEAVFAARGPGQGGANAIPFTIADRPLELESPLLRSFNALLDLAKGRLDAESVLGVLAQPCIMARFGLDDDALEMIRAWVGESGIRWGLSAADRAARGLPEEGLHSWAYGLKRMILGVALPQQLLASATDAVPLYANSLPFDAIEGVRTQSLSRLIEFIEALECTLQQLAQPRSVAEWAELLPQICQRFCYDTEQLARAEHSTQRAVQKLLTTLQGLVKAATQAKCAEALPLDVMRRELSARLNDMAPAWAFLGGGVTFAQLLAYRGVPARVVCLIGMNDGVFPRNPAVPGFDLLHRYPMPGDREARAEDRHAFFEALLSVRDTLHISYSGRGLRDNAELPPSTLVSELMDVLEATAQAADGQSAVAALTTVHRLQAFSPRYFDGSDARLYSHADYYAAAANARGAGLGLAAPFLDAELPDIPESLLNISPQQFSRFFRNPAQHLLRSRFGIHLEESEGLLDTVEPFVPADLARYHLRNQLVLDWQNGVQTRAEAEALAAARGQLPHGQAGQVYFAALWNEFEPFAAAVSAAMGSPMPPCRIDLHCDGLTIAGSLGDLYQTDEGVLHMRWRVGKVRAQDKLQLWVEHLLLHAAGVHCRSRLLASEGEFVLAPLSDVALAPLVRCYLQGSRSLLPFFPATSLNWLHNSRTGKPKNWRKDWEASEKNHSAESEEPYIALAWRGVSPFDGQWHEAFTAAATTIYGAMPTDAEDDSDE